MCPHVFRKTTDVNLLTRDNKENNSQMFGDRRIKLNKNLIPNWTCYRHSNVNISSVENIYHNISSYLIVFFSNYFNNVHASYRPRYESLSRHIFVFMKWKFHGKYSYKIFFFVQDKLQFGRFQFRLEMVSRSKNFYWRTLPARQWIFS